MGEIVYLRDARASESSAKKRQGANESARKYIGLNLYLERVRGEKARVVRRGVLHGILAAFGFQFTSGLTKELFRTGGLFKVRCPEQKALAMLDWIEKYMPDLDARLVRPRRVAA